MWKIEDTFVTVKGTFANYESGARDFASYTTAEIYLKNGIRQNKENSFCVFDCHTFAIAQARARVSTLRPQAS